MPRPCFLRCASGALALAASLASIATAQEEPKPAPAFNGPVLVIEHAAADKFLVDPRDRALSDALAMLPARLRELPHQVPNMPPEAAGIVNMVLTAVARPGRLAVTYNEEATGGAFGYGVIFSVLTADQAEADQMHGRISAMLKEANKSLRTRPSKRFAGMTEIQTPVAGLSFGPRQAKDGWRYEIMFGTIDDPDAVSEALPAPTGDLDAIVRGRFDLAGLLPALDMAEGFAAQNPQAQEQLQMARERIGGEHPIRVSFVSGYSKTESISRFVVDNAQASRETLTAADYAAIPSDTTEVLLTRADNFDSLPQALKAREPKFEEILEQFRGATGVDLEQDVLAAIGGTIAVYLSDTTGGGSLGSAVMMITLKDRARFASALNKLAAVANQHADAIPIGPGYVRLANWKDGKEGADLLSLRFPGLPVPLELSIAMTDKWLILAPTPQAAVAASRQAAGHGDGGLTANKLFAAQFKGSRKLTSLSFSDTQRNLRAGYPFLTLFGSLVANTVRSPSDPEREPGMVVPLYNDLAREARASVSMTWWDGDRMITEARGDRSVLVRAGGAVGLVSKVLPLAMIPAAIGAGVAEQQKHRHAAPAGEAAWLGEPGGSVLGVASEFVPDLRWRRAVVDVVRLAAPGAGSPLSMAPAHR